MKRFVQLGRAIMTSVRKLNAAAESAVSLAIRAGCDTRRGSSKLDLEESIATCEKALEWGFTPGVLCRAAEAHLELGKVLLLSGDDKGCLQSLDKAQGLLEKIEHTYEGIDNVKNLKLEVELDMARALAHLGHKTQAKTKLETIRNDLPRKGRLRKALEELLARLMDQDQQNDGPVRRSSVEAAPHRKKFVIAWGKAREEQLKNSSGKQVKNARLGVSVAPLPTNDDDDDDGVAIVGVVTRAERNLAGRSAAVDLTMDDDEMMLPDGTRIDELGLDEAALLRPPEAPHAPPAAPLPAPAALAAVPSVAMPAAASLPPVPVAPGQLTAASTAAAAAAGSKRLKDSDDDEEVVVGQRSRQRSRRGEQNAQIEIATPESISSPAAAAAPEKQSTSEHTQGVPSAGVQHKEPDKDKDKASLAAKVGLIKNEFRIDQKMPMHQAMSVAEAELGFQACNEQSMLQRVEQVLKAAGL